MKYSISQKISKKSFAPLGECGVTPDLGESRIMGGHEARYGQFPWVAYLSVRGPDIDKMCAGTLVTPR